ncbi:hypothetical protein QGN23_00510 [Chryseobacterium gotjawalense]|uniref:Uncharacterized protein n=1 Tax=Chryseobacterium gotjawalense TaxID=3042315 RepID=A0ABY8RCT6_9FLAO|nr:hypothetical protein [Chryseobacterium sp. wdc7]WHF51775.1 hypothetical protein QGN23_00510 [Chryseobacterium sp. wdc7]
MQKINNNPFRVIGIVANSSAKEIQSRRGKIQAYARVGKEISSEYDFEFLEPVARSEEVINTAFSEIEQHKNIIDHSLFWFTNLNPIDETAIQHLINGNKEKAIEIWEKITEGKEISSRNFSAFNNIGTLYFLEGSEDKLKQGIEHKIKLIESDHFQDFVHSVADEMYTIDSEKQVQFLIDDLLKQINGKYSTSDKIALFDGNPSVKNYLSGKFTEEPLHRIETQIEQSKKKRASNKINAYRFGSDLFENTGNDLSQLKSILGISDLKYKMISDKLAKELLQCSIDYFNESTEQEIDTDYLQEAMSLATMAQNIAVNKLTKDRIKDNMDTLEDMKDRELSHAIQVLQSVKDSFEENEREIRQQVKQMQDNDILIKMGHKTINWVAVEANIKNSINWETVNDLLTEILPDNKLKKIKHCDNTESKNELWELLNWIKENTLKSSTISMIIDKYKRIPPKLYFEILSADVTNTDSKSNIINSPFYIENIRYIGLKLKLKPLINKKVTLYKKYINPEGKYSNSSKSSPQGYTSCNEITITSETNTIDLGGWGNATECTAQVGEHKIEIYVDHYNVYTKTYQVDWSPGKKTALKRNLSMLEDELLEVKKFKLFRMPEAKEKEVNDVQTKINKARKILMNK